MYVLALKSTSVMWVWTKSELHGSYGDVMDVMCVRVSYSGTLFLWCVASEVGNIQVV